MLKEVSYDDAVNNRIFSDNVTQRMIAVIPAHNEEDIIANTLKSLTEQVVPDDLVLDVFIALDNCTDNTEGEIQQYADQLNLYILKTVDNKQRKVGALNQLYRLFLGDNSKHAQPLSESHVKAVKNIIAIVGLDADVYLAKNCLSTIYTELYSDYRIAAVSANYTCLLPESKHRIPRNLPNREELIARGKFGGPLSRFLAVQQNRSFAQWTIEQKANGYVAEIAGGQCSIFKPEALIEVNERYKLNGVYDNSTDTEDLLLTQQLRSLGWQCVISDTARCYVDSMVTVSSYYNQQLKWASGKLEYMQKALLSTAYARKLWFEEGILFLNTIIRLLLVILIPVSLYIGDFEWNWIWAFPLVVSSILGVVVTLKTSNHRFIDLLLSLTGIITEAAMIFDIKIHSRAWLNSLRIEKVDGWHVQYMAEKGQLNRNYLPYLFGALTVGVLLLLEYTDIISWYSALATVRPYIDFCFDVLTLLTVMTFLLMLGKLFKLRGRHRA